MKFLVEKSYLKQELDRIALLEILLGIFFYLSQIQYSLESESLSSLFFRLLFTAPFAYLYMRLRGMFYYSIWTFNAILLVYIVTDVFTTVWEGHHYSLILNLITLIILALLSVKMLNPVFFPLISWWEYDFRKIKDLKLKIKNGDETLDARVCDFKSDLASVACFNDLELAKNYEMTVKIDNNIHKLKGIVLSKRLYSLGRPSYYGVKIIESEIDLSVIKSKIKSKRFRENA